MRANMHKITWRWISINKPGPNANMEVKEVNAPTELVATVVALADSYVVYAISYDFAFEID